MPELVGQRYARLATFVKHADECSHHITRPQVCNCARKEVLQALANAHEKAKPIELELTRDGDEIRAQVKVIGDQRDETVIDLLLMPGNDYEHERYTPQVYQRRADQSFGHLLNNGKRKQ